MADTEKPGGDGDVESGGHLAGERIVDHDIEEGTRHVQESFPGRNGS